MTPAPDFRLMPPRELVGHAIAALERQAEWGRAGMDAYGPGCVSDELLISVGVNDALANVLRMLKTKGYLKIDEAASVLRSAYAKPRLQPEEPR